MQLLWQDVAVIQDYKSRAILKKAAGDGIHLIEEIMEGSLSMIDNHNVELDRMGDSDSMKFECRSGQVFQWKDLVVPLRRDEESSPPFSPQWSWGV